jgi:GH24 family phage-related lysozyme (muramidase)
MSTLQSIRLVDAARFTERQPEPHQAAAWHWLQEQLTAEQVSEFAGLFRAGPKLTPPPTAGWLAPALQVIREFESFSAAAYPDPGTGGEPWTIGWGSTFNKDGGPFRRGDTISRAEADALLARDVNIAATAVDRALPGVDLTDNQKAALVSFAYNIGSGAFAGSTLVKRLQASEDPNTVARAELPRWNRGAGGVLPGLARRRAAELALFTGDRNPTLATPAQQTARPYLRLTRFGKVRDSRGLEALKLELVRPGVTSTLSVTSGAPGAQAFRTGAASRSGSLEPLPEGRYGLGPVEWANGVGNYSASWGPGLGAVWVAINYQTPGTTARSALGFHLDSNIKTAPGSAGCVVFQSTDDLRKFVGWMNESKPQHLFVDWGLGTCPKPA